MLLTQFTAEEQASPDSTDRQMIVTSVKDFNRRFSGAPRTVKYSFLFYYLQTICSVFSGWNISTIFQF